MKSKILFLCAVCLSCAACTGNHSEFAKVWLLDSVKGDSSAATVVGKVQLDLKRDQSFTAAYFDEIDTKSTVAISGRWVANDLGLKNNMVNLILQKPNNEGNYDVLTVSEITDRKMIVKKKWGYLVYTTTK